MSETIEVDGMQFAISHEHRGGLTVDPTTLWPSQDLLERVGGRHGVNALIDDFYVRIERDPSIGRFFPHFETNAIKSFFVKALGGGTPQSGTTAVGPFHRGTIVTRALATRWLRHLKASLKHSTIPPDAAVEILAWLGPIATKLVNSSDHEANGPMISACGGVQPESFLHRESLLRDAARGRMKEISDALNADPAIVSYYNPDGRSLLWEAAARGRSKLVEYLVDHNADTNAPGCDPSIINLACSGKARLGIPVMVTPWAVSKSKGYEKVAMILREHGALADSFSAAFLNDIAGMSAAFETKPSLLHAEDPAEDFKRSTLLHHAIAGGHHTMASWLIERGARVSPHSDWLLSHAALQNRVDLVKLLLDNGADVHCAGVLGPLDNDHRPVADLLVARGFDLNTDSDYGAMLVRACRGDVSSHESARVKTLLEYGADVNQQHYGLTALHYATRTGRLPLIQLLLDHGADIHLTDHDDLTPLDHLTKTRAKADPVPVIELLCNHGASINRQSPSGETLLFFYARRGDQRLVKWLLNQGADPAVQNNASKNPLEVIQKKKGKEFAAIRTLLRRALTE